MAILQHLFLRWKMGLVRDCKVLGHPQHSVIYGTIFCLYLLLRKPHFPDSGRLVCELTSRICALAEVSRVHEGPAKIMPLTRRLRLHFLILVCGAFQWRRLWSFSLSGTISYQRRYHFKTLNQSARSSYEMLKLITQSQQPCLDGWMDGWVWICVQSGHVTARRTRFMAKHLVIHRLRQTGWGRNEILKLE